MKKFLAIDTSSSYMTVIAQGERTAVEFVPDCAGKHSVRLLDCIEAALSEAGMTLSGCEFFAAVTGAGSFTGIRIGIATVKGLCTGEEKPCLPVTSFETIAYNTGEVKTLTAISAGHGCVYLCGFDENKNVLLPPAYRTIEEGVALSKEYALTAGFEEELMPFFPDMVCVNMAEGLYRAVLEKSERAGELIPCEGLTALYVRKSQAEENRK